VPVIWTTVSPSGVATAWLIARTGKFWPSIALHFLYNFFLLSVTVFQSLYWVD